jgi:ribosomal protein L33
MASKGKKKKKSFTKLIHKATGHIYYTRKNPKLEGKLTLKKYNPKLREHVDYVEGK